MLDLPFTSYSAALQLARDETRLKGRTYCVRRLWNSTEADPRYIVCPMNDSGHANRGPIAGIPTSAIKLIADAIDAEPEETP